MEEKKEGSSTIRLSRCLMNLFVLYRKIWKFKKSYVIISFFSTILLTIKPFTEILFLKVVLDALKDHREISTVILYVLAMCGTNLLLRLLEALMKKYDTMQVERIKVAFLSEVEEITMKMPYDRFNDAKQMEKRAKAYEIFHPTQAEYMDIRNSILGTKMFLSFLLQLIGLTYLLLRLHWVVVIVLYLASFVSIGLDAIAANKEFEVWDIRLVHFGRKIGYLQKISVEKEFAKDVRIYSLSNWITGKMKYFHERTMKEVRKTVNTFSKLSMLSRTLMLTVNFSLYLYILSQAIKDRIVLSDIVVYFNVISMILEVLLSISYCMMILYKAGKFTNVYFSYLKENEAYVQKDTKNVEKSMERMQREDHFNSENSLRVEEHLNSEDRIKDGCIEFEHVYFKYPGNKEYSLKDMNLRFDTRKTTAIVGENGAGKTTIIKLILRLYTPEKGRILFNQKEIEAYPLKDYYELITAVFQDFNILNYSLRENICFHQDIQDVKLQQVVANLNLEQTIKSLPQAYDTQLGKMFDASGVELSGGQAQKVAIARAFVKDTNVIILDEPTAMLSPIAEYEIYTNLRELTKEKTVIFISHRMSSCKFCDNIFVLANGELKESGNHEVLMKKEGIYYELFQTQAKFYKELDHNDGKNKELN